MYGQSLNTGLFFYAHESNIDKRTSLILNENEPYPLNSKDIFAIEFDFFLRNEEIKFGNFLRIISNQEESFDFIVNNNEDLFFIVNKKDLVLKGKPVPGLFNKVKITFDKQANIISLDLNGEIVSSQYDLSRTSNLLVTFGECSYKGFSTNDVPPTIIKDIEVRYNKNLFHEWKLDKHAKDIVYDELKHRGAFVYHGLWLKNNMAYWKKEGTMKGRNFPQITFDSVRNEVLTLNNEGEVIFSLNDKITRFIKMEQNIPSDPRINHFMFNSLTGNIFAYSLNPQEVSHYNPSTRLWSRDLNEIPDYAHHNRYISKKDSNLILFGGYGHYQYKSDLIKVDLVDEKWEKKDMSSIIPPRYLAAMGADKKGDKLYILGGRGTEKGRQEVSPTNFFDLYEVNLETLDAKLIYKLPENLIDKDYVFSNNLVVDDANEYLYVLSYPNAKYASHILLKRLSLKEPEIETFGDTIKFFFHDMTSFCDLYYSPSLNKLVAVAAYSEDDVTSKINIYSLDFPPLQEKDILQLTKPSSPFSAKNWILPGITTICIILIIIVLFFLWKKNKVRKIREVFDSPESDVEVIDWSPTEKYYDRNKSSIIFLGGFQIFDKNGKNLTGEFTPTLRFLLVLIILYTLKDGKGIASVALQEFLWFDKPEEAARNNRNVNIRKLRMLLEEIGNITISNKNSYWTIELSDAIFSDYNEVFRLIENAEVNRFNNVEDLKRLLELVSYGNMLPNIQYEWIDNFKSDFTNKIIDTLTYFIESKNKAIADDLSLHLKIADTILTYDTINEDAIIIKCQILYKIGKKGLAKTVFNNFTRDYKALLNETYNKTLAQIIESC